MQPASAVVEVHKLSAFTGDEYFAVLQEQNHSSSLEVSEKS